MKFHERDDDKVATTQCIECHQEVYSVHDSDRTVLLDQWHRAGIDRGEFIVDVAARTAVPVGGRVLMRPHACGHYEKLKAIEDRREYLSRDQRWMVGRGYLRLIDLESEVDARSVGCPKCFTMATEPCLNLSRNKARGRPIKGTHRDRFDAALKALDLKLKYDPYVRAWFVQAPTPNQETP